jgi:hypothetical protein
MHKVTTEFWAFPDVARVPDLPHIYDHSSYSFKYIHWALIYDAFHVYDVFSVYAAVLSVYSFIKFYRIARKPDLTHTYDYSYYSFKYVHWSLRYDIFCVYTPGFVM